MLTRNGEPLPALEALFAGLKRSSLLLAVSGGPDSMALLDMADRWRRVSGAAIAVATVDHGLRPASRAEAGAVRRAAAERGLPHEILTWTGEKPKTGLPAAARAARYALLASHAAEIGADTIVTAHHADDQVETVLMRLLRGSGPAGLAGMARLSALPGHETIRLARPLLDLTKADLVAWCKERGLAFFDDPTNADETYRRPQLRRLAGLLSAEGFDRPQILRLAARAARAESALAELLARKLAELPARRDPDFFEAAFADIASLSDEALIRLLAAEIARISGETPRLEQIESAAARLRAGPPVALTLGGVSVRLGTAMLRLRPQPPRKPRQTNV